MSPEQTLGIIQRFLGYNFYRAILAGVYVSSGDRNEALRELGILATDDFGRIRRDGNWIATLVLAADLVWDLGEPRYAETLYDLLRPYAGRCAGVGPMIVSLGPVDLRLGRLAAARGRRDQAASHQREAVALAERMGARPYLAEARYALARVLADSADGEDRERARVELDAALAIARELGMAKLVEDTLALKLELTGVAGRGLEGQTLPLEPPSR
jgi:tetratricopeptide (TPR) repeat protein